ncbi:glycosyltransferase family 2 protein [Microbacterium luticocti]|uniref:glycosyltransferase family 2 protein n=1 Tax=Microbacterium luticocti TaxID=451764 RepID=UPI00048FE471|nr:glycosyltransferase family 2 protein [Microbacterium luticocti]
MRRPIATVILPAKDAGPYVGTTLQTLLRQFDDPDALKLVAVDDGSSDDTGQSMREYAERFGTAEVIANPEPVGLASARNQGLAHVEGDLFCFIDGDDWMQPLRLQTLAAALHDLDCDFVRTDHVTVTGRRRALVTAPFPWRGRAVPPREAILPVDDSSMVDYPYAWAGMFHRRVLDAGLADFCDGLFTAEDRPWIWRLHLHAASFAVVDAPHLLYRRGVPTSLTQIADRRQLDFARAFEQVLDLVEHDAQSDRFLPKATMTVLAISAHHLIRSRRMPTAVRAELVTGVRSLLGRLDPALMARCLPLLSDPRRRVLARHLRKAVHG